jgi:hypothetical protein
MKMPFACVWCLQVTLASSLSGNKTLSALLQGKLVKGVLVKGAKHAMQSSIGAGAGLAAGALSGLPVTTFEPFTAATTITKGSSTGEQLLMWPPKTAETVGCTALKA